MQNRTRPSGEGTTQETPPPWLTRLCCASINRFHTHTPTPFNGGCDVMMFLESKHPTFCRYERVQQQDQPVETSDILAITPQGHWAWYQCHADPLQLQRKNKHTETEKQMKSLLTDSVTTCQMHSLCVCVFVHRWARFNMYEKSTAFHQRQKIRLRKWGEEEGEGERERGRDERI